MVSPPEPSALPIVGASCLITLGWVCVTDLRRRIIPNRALVAGAIPVLLAFAFWSPSILPGRLLWAALASLPLGLVAGLRPAALGMGDVKLVAFLGFCLGPPVVVAFIVASLTGSVAGVWILIRRGLSARKATVPFAPFLAIGTLVAWGTIS